MNRLISIGICISLPAIAFFGFLWKAIDLSASLGSWGAGFTEVMDVFHRTFGISWVNMLPALFAAVPSFYVAGAVCGISSKMKYAVMAWSLAFVTFIGCAFTGAQFVLLLAALAVLTFSAFTFHMENLSEHTRRSKGEDTIHDRQKRYRSTGEIAIWSVLIVGVFVTPAIWAEERNQSILKKSAIYAELTDFERAVVDAKIDVYLSSSSSGHATKIFDIWLSEEGLVAPNESNLEDELTISFLDGYWVKCTKVDGEVVVDTLNRPMTKLIAGRLCSLRGEEY